MLLRAGTIAVRRAGARGLVGASPLRALCVCVRGWSSSADRAGLGDFNELRERSLLAHVIKTAPEGNAEAVMQAMDDFWDTSFGGAGSEEWKLRGAALDMAIKAKRPAQAMEVGTYCGYTAVRVGRLLPPGGKLISVEIDSLFAAIASKVRARSARRRRPATRLRRRLDAAAPPPGPFPIVPPRLRLPRP